MAWDKISYSSFVPYPPACILVFFCGKKPQTPEIKPHVLSANINSQAH